MDRKNKLARKAMLAEAVVREIHAEERVGEAVAKSTRSAHEKTYWALCIALNRAIEWASVRPEQGLKIVH